jgi:hypothetical protein
VAPDRSQASVPPPEDVDPHEDSSLRTERLGAPALMAIPVSSPIPSFTGAGAAAGSSRFFPDVTSSTCVVVACVCACAGSLELWLGMGCRLCVCGFGAPLCMCPLPGEVSGVGMMTAATHACALERRRAIPCAGYCSTHCAHRSAPTPSCLRMSMPNAPSGPGDPLTRRRTRRPPPWPPLRPSGRPPYAFTPPTPAAAPHQCRPTYHCQLQVGQRPLPPAPSAPRWRTLWWTSRRQGAPCRRQCAPLPASSGTAVCSGMQPVRV